MCELSGDGDSNGYNKVVTDQPYSNYTSVIKNLQGTYECPSKIFRIGRLERELQMTRLSATKCSCIAILWVSLVNFATTILYIASQRVFVVIPLWLCPETFGYTLRKVNIGAGQWVLGKETRERNTQWLEKKI
jgi:hypothetical protein